MTLAEENVTNVTSVESYISCTAPWKAWWFWRLWGYFFFLPCYGLIDTSLWWSDMIDFSCLSSRQVIFIYLPCLPLLLSCSLLFSHLLREFWEKKIIFQYRTVSLLHTETRISHVTSTAQSCNQNPLTFQNWWVRVMHHMKKHLLNDSSKSRQRALLIPCKAHGHDATAF